MEHEKELEALISYVVAGIVVIYCLVVLRKAI